MWNSIVAVPDRCLFLYLGQYATGTTAICVLCKYNQPELIMTCFINISILDFGLNLTESAREVHESCIY